MVSSPCSYQSNVHLFILSIALLFLLLQLYRRVPTIDQILGWAPSRDVSTESAYKLRIVAITCYVLASIGVTLRFYVRKFFVGKVCLDDWQMAAALGFYTMYVNLRFRRPVLWHWPA